MSRARWVVVLGLGCTSVEPAGRPADGPEADPRTVVPFAVCDEQPAPPAESTAAWRHGSTHVIAAFAPWHSGIDVVASAGEAAVLRAKFSYGSLGKDLEDEWVEAWIDRCDALESLGWARTDGDGRIAIGLDADAVPAIGRHRLHFRVGGDGSSATAMLYVLPPDTRLTVFDIDGTLTTSDWELVEDLVDDVFEPMRHGVAPQAREGAAPITRVRAAQGYVPIYLTGRPYWLTDRTRAWLGERGMAPGILVTAQSTAQLLPTEAGVGAYKADVLAALQLQGLVIDLAYGNAATDLFAYDDAGIDGAATYILGRHGGERGTVALGESFSDHLQATFAAIAQPFAPPAGD